MQPSGTRLGQYEILAPLGAGGMGEVYRARDAKLNRDVAIKILPDTLASNPAAHARFEREAQAIAALSHPNILGIFDFGVDRNVPYAVMELLDGGTLREQLYDGAIPLRKAIEYATQISAGLGAAHARGITHRDLKPENIFVTRDGRIKILDFGLAKMGVRAVAEAAPSMMATSPVLTGAGTIVGTVGYMSPEQVRGREVDHRSDIFSFGAILYEMLSGQRAFAGDSAVETMNAILKEEPPEFTQTDAALPPAIDRIVRRCLEKNPDERFQSSRDVAFAIDAISTARSDPATPALQAIARRSSRTIVWRIAAAVVVALAIGAAAFIAGSRRVGTSAPRLTRLTFDRGTVRSARFAPDGRTIVYGAAWHGQPIRIFQTRLGSPESIPLQLPDADVLAVAPSGEMAIGIGFRFSGWLGNGTLARVPLVGGSPREIVETVSTADWSPKGDELAIVRRVNGKDRLEYPVGKVLYETTGYVSQPRVSSAGDAIAFLDHPIYGDNRGWMSVISTIGERRRLTKEWAAVEGLAWSPDGREIWYTAGDGGANVLRGVTLAGVDRQVWAAPSDLAILDTSPDGRVLLTANSLYSEIKWLGSADAQERDISWFAWSTTNDISRDGRATLFTRFDEGAGLEYQIGFRRLDASSTTSLGTGQAVALSPDSKSALGITFGQPGIFVLPTGPGERRVLTRPGFKYTFGGWFPDGKRILFVAEHSNELPAAYAQDLDGADPRKVPSLVPALSGGAIALRVSPDSQWFFGPQAGAVPIIVPIDHGLPRTLTMLTRNDSLLEWTPDGHGVLVGRKAQDQSSVTIARLDLQSGRLDTLKTVRIGDTGGIRAFGLLVTPDGRSIVYTIQRYLTDLYLVEGLK